MSTRNRSRTYKNATPVPPGIEAPDMVETRLGTLHLYDGVPDDATVEALFDNLDFQRAVQAYLLALPPVNQVAMRKALLQWGPPNTTLPIWEECIDPRYIGLTTNNNTPYSWMWIDLHAGPLVAEIPPKVLGCIDDFWYRWVVDVGLTGPDGGAGGKYQLLPPGYKGEVPEGYFVVRPRTYGMFLAWRSFLVDSDPKPGIELVKKFAKVYPLSAADNPPDLTFVNVSHKPFCSVGPGDYTFWEYLNEVVQEEPPESLDPVTLGFFASIGIQHGKPFAPDKRMRKILEEAAAVGDATARAFTYRTRERAAYYSAESAWRTGFLGGYKFEDNGARVLDMQAASLFYATIITPAMEVKMIGQGSQYAAAFADANGHPLDGGKNYRLHLPPNIPVNNFWSVIVYDN